MKPAKPIPPLHLPSFRRAVAAGADKAPAIDDPAGMSPDPPSQLPAVDFAALVGNVVKHLTQFRMLFVEYRRLLHGIAHHGRRLAEYRLPGRQQPAQCFPVRVFGHGLEHRYRRVGAAQPQQRLPAQVGPVAIPASDLQLVFGLPATIQARTMVNAAET